MCHLRSTALQPRSPLWPAALIHCGALHFATTDGDRSRHASGTALQGDAKRPLTAGLADTAGEQTLGHGGIAKQTSIRATSNRTRGDNEEIIRIKGINTWWILTQKEIGSQKFTAAINPPE